jgi:hypothetical protein
MAQTAGNSQATLPGILTSLPSTQVLEYAQVAVPMRFLHSARPE